MFPVNSILVNRIKLLMKKQGFNVNTLAQRTELSTNELQSYLNHKAPLDNMHKLIKISNALGTTFSELLVGDSHCHNLESDELRLLKLYKTMTPAKKQCLLAFLKGCKYS